MYFFSIEESAKHYNKSVSTIKRVVSDLKKNNPNQYNDSNIIKLERLKTGHDKIFISKDFLNGHFNSAKEKVNNSVNSSTNHSTNSSDSTAIELLKETIELLKKELEVKNGQIDALNDRLRESNTIAIENTRNSSKMLVEDVTEQKKRWWKW
jgi:hypothetical protein